jgi:hypothetical protein
MTSPKMTSWTYKSSWRARLVRTAGQPRGGPVFSHAPHAVRQGDASFEQDGQGRRPRYHRFHCPSTGRNQSVWAFVCFLKELNVDRDLNAHHVMNEPAKQTLHDGDGVRRALE